MKELEEILSKVIRSNVRQNIVQCVSNVKSKIEELEGEKAATDKIRKQNDVTADNANQLYNVKITTYGKIYIIFRG